MAFLRIERLNSNEFQYHEIYELVKILLQI